MATEYIIPVPHSMDAPWPFFSRHGSGDLNDRRLEGMEQDSVMQSNIVSLESKEELGPESTRDTLAEPVVSDIDGAENLRETNRQLLRRIERLERLAYFDDLTGLGNRRFFFTALDDEIRRSVRHRSPVSVLLCDVDQFKAHNDHFGHSGGDTLLGRIGEVLHGACRRAGDRAARYGGDEFAVMFPQTFRDDALRLAEDIRRMISAMARAETEWAGRAQITLSIGVTTFDTNHASASSAVIEAADRALYRAKNSGRDRVEFEAFRP